MKLYSGNCDFVIQKSVLYDFYSVALELECYARKQNGAKEKGISRTKKELEHQRKENTFLWRTFSLTLKLIDFRRENLV